jgi:hypothetical protein
MIAVAIKVSKDISFRNSESTESLRQLTPNTKCQGRAKQLAKNVKYYLTATLGNSCLFSIGQ